MPDDVPGAVGAVLTAHVRALGTGLVEQLSRPSVFRDGLPIAERPQLSTGCYEASWGWVHVKPGCHCR